jgi:hypothetical protein
MARLTPQQQQARLKFDYQVVTKMRSPQLNVTAYRSASDLEKRSNPIVSEDVAGLATHYLVVYHMRTLVGPDRYSEKTSVKFDLLANGDYPFSRPACYVVSSEMPWTPHFREKLPICIDHEMWEDAQGQMLLGHLFVHIAKLLNFDEIPRTDDYGGYTPEAADYWRTKLNRRPLDPNLVYPVLPSEISQKPEESFSAAGSQTNVVSLFEPKAAGGGSSQGSQGASAANDDSDLFQPASSEPTGDSMFTPGTRR